MHTWSYILLLEKFYIFYDQGSISVVMMVCISQADKISLILDVLLGTSQNSLYWDLFILEWWWTILGFSL